MSDRNPSAYKPAASEEAILAAKTAIDGAVDLESFMGAMREHAVKVGYKVFCYMAIGKVDAETLIRNKSLSSEELAQIGKDGKFAAAQPELPIISPEEAKLAAMKRFGLIK